MEEKKQDSSSSENIFEELWADAQDIEKLEQSNKKDVYFYISMIWGLLKIVNIVLFITIIVLFVYTTIQKSKQDFNLSFLEPICFVFMWNVKDATGCSWVNSKIVSYTTKFDQIKANQFEKIRSIIADIYASENFLYSKEVTFLLDKSKNRVLPLEILTSFDFLKSSFEPYEKGKIKCFNINISSNNVVDMTCEAYSSDWDREIIGFDGEKVNTSVQGTSISLANSFINYIEKSSTKFTVVDKQKVFSSAKVSDTGVSYTKKTTFILKLLYNNNNL